MRIRLLVLVALASACVSYPGFAGKAHVGAKPTHGDPEEGGRLFQQHCVMCHSPIAGRKLVGPSLQTLTETAAGPRGTERARTVISNGKGTMPAFKARVSMKEMSDLIAYLHQQ